MPACFGHRIGKLRTHGAHAPRLRQRAERPGAGVDFRGHAGFAALLIHAHLNPQGKDAASQRPMLAWAMPLAHKAETTLAQCIIRFQREGKILDRLAVKPFLKGKEQHTILPAFIRLAASAAAQPPAILNQRGHIRHRTARGRQTPQGKGRCNQVKQNAHPTYILSGAAIQLAAGIIPKAAVFRKMP